MGKYAEKKMFEIALPGFDGSTDETDDKVLWIEVPADCTIETKSNSGIDISELPRNFDKAADLVIKRSK